MDPLDPSSAEPVTTLTVPGLGGSGPEHWQTLWERTRPYTRRAELGRWDDPDRGTWVRRLDEAIGACRGPVMLVGHSLGCFAITWWATLLHPTSTGPVVGALLVAPPDLDRPDAPSTVRSFGPSPRTALPFRSIMVASSDDPWITVPAARELASAWGSALIAVDGGGHLNAASNLGRWTFGQELLDQLIIAAP